MTYEDAVMLRNKNVHRIGEVTEKGFTINEIIIVPYDEHKRNSFFLQYLVSHDAMASITPYMNDEVLVWAIDTKHLEQNNMLFYDNIE